MSLTWASLPPSLHQGLCWPLPCPSFMPTTVLRGISQKRKPSSRKQHRLRVSEVQAAAPVPAKPRELPSLSVKGSSTPSGAPHSGGLPCTGAPQRGLGVPALASCL